MGASIAERRVDQPELRVRTQPVRLHSYVCLFMPNGALAQMSTYPFAYLPKVIRKAQYGERLPIPKQLSICPSGPLGFCLFVQALHLAERRFD